jgi:hypothetical protein
MQPSLCVGVCIPRRFITISTEVVMTTLLTLAIITLTSAASSPDMAARPVDDVAVTTTASKTVLVETAPIVKIDCDAADVRVVSWLSDKVHVQSTGSQGTLAYDRTHNSVMFHHKDETRSISQDIYPATHTIYVPANAVVEIFNASGNVHAEGSFANLSVNVDQGNVTLRNVSGATEVASTSGTVTRIETGEPAQPVVATSF